MCFATMVFPSATSHSQTTSVLCLQYGGYTDTGSVHKGQSVMCQLDGVGGCLESWENIISGCVHLGVSRKDEHLSPQTQESRWPSPRQICIIHTTEGLVRAKSGAAGGAEPRHGLPWVASLQETDSDLLRPLRQKAIPQNKSVCTYMYPTGSVSPGDPGSYTWYSFSGGFGRLLSCLNCNAGRVSISGRGHGGCQPATSAGCSTCTWHRTTPLRASIFRTTEQRLKVMS